MPGKQTMRRARRDAWEGKAPSTQAGEFVREEIHHVRGGQHGARSTKQAIAIGLSKARRAGVALKAPSDGNPKTLASARSARKNRGKRPSPRRSSAVRRALSREGRRSASRGALARQARNSASRRGSENRRAAARKASRTRARNRRRGRSRG
jgi:hypothetical protein